MEFDPDRDGMRPPPLTRNCYNALVMPRPIGWISTLSPVGVVNLAPYSFFNSVSGDPPCVMFCANGSHREGGRKNSVVNAEATGEFVFNLCTYDLRERMVATAAHLPRSVDEMAAAGLAAAPSVKVRPPRVAASPIHLECRYLQTVQLPTGPGGTENYTVFGRVVQVHISDAVLTDGMVDVRKLRPLARLGYLDYAVIDEVFRMARPD